jgi:hypothetical protein
MTIAQMFVFWLTVIAWLSLFVEQPAKPAPMVDGLIPVRREWMK